MGAPWGQQDPGGLNVGPNNLAIWVWLQLYSDIVIACYSNEGVAVTKVLFVNFCIKWYLFAEKCRNISPGINNFELALLIHR